MNGLTRSLALWAALVAFFGNLLAFKVVGLLVSGENLRLGLSALITSAVVGGLVYTRTRRDAVLAQREKENPR